MNIVTMNCPQCDGVLEFSEDKKQAFCPSCNSHFFVDDKAKYIKIDNAEQTGYEFEQGRIRAQQEILEVERKRRNLAWWIFGWIFCFPIPLTILVVKSKKLKTAWKIVLIAVLWTVLPAVLWSVGSAMNDFIRDAVHALDSMQS